MSRFYPCSQSAFLREFVLHTLGRTGRAQAQPAWLGATFASAPARSFAHHVAGQVKQVTDSGHRALYTLPHWSQSRYHFATWLKSLSSTAPPLAGSFFPALRLSIPQHAWGLALASPLLMRPIALCSGLPGMVSQARSHLGRTTFRLLRDNSLGHTATRLPVPYLRAQIDACLRNSMELALQTCSTSSASARLVILNGLHICGKNLPYLLGLLLADAAHRRTADCLAPLRAPLAHAGPAAGDISGTTWAHWARVVLRDIEESVSLLLHVLRLTVLFAPLVLSAPLAFYWGIGRQAWYEKLRETMEAGGPAFIKWGQWAATRQDMFPPDMCRELAMLQTDAPTHAWAFSKRTLEESFGMPLEELVDWIEHKPMASGSIGQVHKAALSRRGAEVCGMRPGKVVVMKVKHPNVSQSIQRDFGLMMWIAHQLEWFPVLRKMRLSESLSQFAAPLREQVDLSFEANNLWRFNQNFAKDKLVSLPVPLYPWVSQDVLVQSFEEGMHISDYMKLDTDVARRGAVAGVGSHCMLNMMLVHHFIHSDLHPGNILVRWQLPDGPLIEWAAAAMQLFSKRPPEEVFASWLQPHIVLLDVGMATELSGADNLNMLHLFKAFAEMDGLTMADSALAFAGKKQHCIDPEGFRQAIEKHLDVMRVDSWEETGYGNSAAAFSSILDIIRDYEVTIPGHICAVLITTLVLEGWSSELAPERSVLEEVKSIVAMDTRSWRERLSSTVDAWQEWLPVLPSLDNA